MGCRVVLISTCLSWITGEEFLLKLVTERVLNFAHVAYLCFLTLWLGRLATSDFCYMYWNLMFSTRFQEQTFLLLELCHRLTRSWM